MNNSPFKHNQQHDLQQELPKQFDSVTDQDVEDLTLLLLYLSSWRNVTRSRKTKQIIGEGTLQSWKGYPFECLNALSAKELILDSRTAKSIYLTEAGERRSQELLEKMLGKSFSVTAQQIQNL
jgi:hypothetical protein